MINVLKLKCNGIDGLFHLAKLIDDVSDDTAV